MGSMSTALTNVRRSLSATRKDLNELEEETSAMREATVGTLITQTTAVLCAVVDHATAGRTGPVPASGPAGLALIFAGAGLGSRDVVNAGHMALGVATYQLTRNKLAAAWS